MSTYIEKSTIKNLNRNDFIWNPTFNAKIDSKGKWTGSESFTCRMKDVTRILPTLGSACQMEGFGFLLASDVSIQNIEGDLAEVTIGYGGFQDNNFTFNENNLNNYTYDLQIQSSEDNIKSFVDFTETGAVTNEEKILINNFDIGAFVQIPVSEGGNGYKLCAAGDSTYSSVGEVTSVEAKKLMDYIANGVLNYYNPKQVWRVSYTTRSRPSGSDLNDVGKIGDPRGAPSVTDRDWLFLGLSVSENEKIFTITEEWLLSGRGGWDAKLYD